MSQLVISSTVVPHDTTVRYLVRWPRRSLLHRSQTYKGRQSTVPVLAREGHVKPCKSRLQHISFSALIGAGALWAAPALAVRPEGYTPSPVELGWQVWFGAAAAAFPFLLGLVEFSKRIIIQQRCSSCQGSGLVTRGSKMRKCNECGGFFPWQSWSQFFTSTAAPGNGGPLIRPKGQTSVLYRILPQPSDDQPSDT